MRERLAGLMRLLQRWPVWICVAIGSFVVLLSRELEDGAKEGVTWLAIVSLLFSFAQLLRETGASFWIWRFLQPRYRGLDMFLRRIDGSASFLNCFMVEADGSLRVDGPGLMRRNEGLLRRMAFCGSDLAANQVAARINAKAFSGTRYGDSYEGKRRRNSEIAACNPLTFCLLNAPEGRTGYVGLAAVFPLSLDGYVPYAAGRLADNDFRGRHIAPTGVEPVAILIFLIAHSPIIGDRHVARRHDDGVLEDLIKLCLVQICLIAADVRRGRHIAIMVANPNAKMMRLFEILGFERSSEVLSADGAAVYSGRMIIDRPAEAARLAAGLIPDFTTRFPDILSGAAS